MMTEDCITSTAYKEDLLNDKRYAGEIANATNMEDWHLTNMLKKTMSHPKYRKGRHTAMVTDIMERGKDFTPRQRACLEIHHAKEISKLVANG